MALVNKISKKERSELMSKIRSKETSCEMSLKPYLQDFGFLYQEKILGISVDFANRETLTAIFTEGCFWHQCPIHGTMPKSNIKYWRPKLKINMERDQENIKKLIKAGWRVMRIWEHNIPRKFETKQSVKKLHKLIGLIEDLLVIKGWEVIII